MPELRESQPMKKDASSPVALSLGWFTHYFRKFLARGRGPGLRASTEQQTERLAAKTWSRSIRRDGRRRTGSSHRAAGQTAPGGRKASPGGRKAAAGGGTAVCRRFSNRGNRYNRHELRKRRIAARLCMNLTRAPARSPAFRVRCLGSGDDPGAQDGLGRLRHGGSRRPASTLFCH